MPFCALGIGREKWISDVGVIAFPADFPGLSAFLEPRSSEMDRCWESARLRCLSGYLCVPFRCGNEHPRLKQVLSFKEDEQSLGWKYLQSRPFLQSSSFISVWALSDSVLIANVCLLIFFFDITKLLEKFLLVDLNVGGARVGVI